MFLGAKRCPKVRAIKFKNIEVIYVRGTWDAMRPETKVMILRLARAMGSKELVVGHHRRDEVAAFVSICGTHTTGGFMQDRVLVEFKKGYFI